MKGLRWIVRNGHSMNLWMDFWFPNGRLRESIEGPLYRGEEELTVRQCYDENHNWKPASISLSSQLMYLTPSRPPPSLMCPKLVIVSCGPISKMVHSLFKQPTSLQGD